MTTPRPQHPVIRRCISAPVTYSVPSCRAIATVCMLCCLLFSLEANAEDVAKDKVVEELVSVVSDKTDALVTAINDAIDSDLDLPVPSALRAATVEPVPEDGADEDPINAFKDKSFQDVFTKTTSKTEPLRSSVQGDQKNTTKVSFKSNANELQDRSPLAAALQEALRDISEFQERQRPVPAGTMVQPRSVGRATTASKSPTPATVSPTLATPSKAKKSGSATATVSPSVASRKSLPQEATVVLDSKLDSYFKEITPSDAAEALAPSEESLTASKRSETTAANSTAVPAAVPATPSVAEPKPEPVSSSPVLLDPEPEAVAPVQKPFQYQEPRVVITSRMRGLQPKIAKTLRFYFDRPLNTKDDSAWSVMHSFLGYGPSGQLAINGERGNRTNALSWMCQNGPLMGRRLFYIQDGYIRGVEGPGYQGHPGQFLAMLAQIGVQRDYPMNIQGRQLSVEDLINSEMYTCSSQKELTFKLIALSYYLNSDAKWTSDTGETWDIPKVLSLELTQPVNGAACGGTHRVMAISNAVRNREMRGEAIDGPYVQAKDYIRQYQRYTLSLQNRNGSFSTQWFKGRADNGDKDRQLQTTGHLLEWLVYSLPRNELSDPRIVNGVEFLQNLMSRNRYRDWEVGPRGHAIRALALYHYRVFERQSSSPRAASVSSLWSNFR